MNSDMNAPLRVKTNKPCDYKEWVLSFDLWPVSQAVHIILGCEPPDLDDIKQYDMRVKADDPTWQGEVTYTKNGRLFSVGPWEEYERIWSYLRSSLASHKLNSYAKDGVEYVVPAHFLLWASENRIALPEELKSLLFSNRLRLDVDQVEGLIKQHVELNAKLEKLEEENKQLKGESSALKEQKERSYLNVIGALLGFIKGEPPKTNKHPDYVSEAKLIERLDVGYKDCYGISRRNLEDKFKLARRSIERPD